MEHQNPYKHLHDHSDLAHKQQCGMLKQKGKSGRGGVNFLKSSSEVTKE